MPGQPLATWTPGAPLANFRQLSFGLYTFPLTFQESSRVQSIAFDKRKIQFGMGDYVAPNSSVQGRVTTFVGTVGSGMIGITGNNLVTDTDLENERAALAGLQALGPQQLYTRFDRYVISYLDTFEFDFLQDGGAFRYADYKLTFYSADPRYYSVNANTASFGPITDAATHSQAVSHAGTVRAWPTITFTGKCTSPSIAIKQGPTKQIMVTFSGLTMAAGDTLTIQCDPRPEFRNFCAIYTPFGGSPVNALQFVTISNFFNTLDFSQFFPFIEANQNTLGTQTFSFANTNASASYTVAFSYNDTWL